MKNCAIHGISGEAYSFNVHFFQLVNDYNNGEKLFQWKFISRLTPDE